MNEMTSTLATTNKPPTKTTLSPSNENTVTVDEVTHSEEEPEDEQRSLRSSSDVKEAATTTEEGWEVLPEELMVHIFSFLSIKDLFVASLVSKRWKQLVEDGTM